MSMAERIEHITLADLPKKTGWRKGLGHISTRKLTEDSGFVASVAWYWANSRTGLRSITFIVLDTEAEESYIAAQNLRNELQRLKPRTKA